MGLVMYYFFTDGKHPFDTGPGCDIHHNVKEYKKRNDDFDCGLIPGASSLIQRMISKDPLTRYSIYLCKVSTC